jgi:Rad3-related DNA helicase
MTIGDDLRVGVLADEAHNLVERARAMYSGQLDQAAVRGLRSTAPAGVRPAFDKLNRSWATLRKAQQREDGTLDAVPASFLTALKNASTTLETHFAEAAPGSADGPLQQFYFDALAFQRLAESFGTHSVIELAEQGAAFSKPATTVRIQNLIPASFLRPRFAAARTVTLFSATLSPPRYFLDMLGLPETTARIDVESPFDASQLEVQVVRRISTRYADRGRSAEPIARLIADRYAAQAGNYLAFFSSFDYLDLVAGEFQRRYPEVPVWTQVRGMDEASRHAFLARFQPGGAGVGFAVLGGSFGEGIDLRGDRLVGAFVATLGLPQVNPRNEQLKARLEDVFGSGYDYTYLVPGIQKVVQAAGRVIRTQEDRGIVYLIDDRFARPAVRELLPAWWRLRFTEAAV